MTTALRRTLLLVVLATLLGAAYAWWTGRSGVPAPAAPPQWPPLPTVDPSGGESPWVPANADGSCPEGFPVKVKQSSGIYHVPGGRFHERTRPDRCYATAEAAHADGYRPSKS